MAANVSDTVYLDEVKAVAFTTMPANDDVVRDFVNNPSNSPQVFDMINLDTFQTVTSPQNLYQANVVAFVNKDSSGNPIQSTGPIGYQNAITYYPYVVSKNRGGYQLVQSVAIEPMYQILLHVDAQDPNGYDLVDGNVTTVYDLSQHVAGSHASTLVGKTTATSPFRVTAPMTLTDTFNGHHAFDGFIQFGRKLSNPPGDQHFDVMKKNTNESYSIFIVFSCTSLNTWGQVFNFIRGNGNEGVCLVGSGDKLDMAIANKFNGNVETKFPPTTAFSLTYPGTILLAAVRFHRTRVVGTTYYYDYSMKFINMYDPTMPVVHDVHVQDVVVETKRNATELREIYGKSGGHLFLGGDDLMYNYGETYRPVNYKVGECLFYNQFINDTDTELLLNHLKNKWKAAS